MGGATNIEVKSDKAPLLNSGKQHLLDLLMPGETESINPVSGLIILAYIIVITFTPSWGALDTNATKFFTLSIVNLVSFLYIVISTYVRKDSALVKKFFTTNVVLVYSGFLIISLLSFVKAINLHESVLRFTMLMSVFSAVFILAVLLMRDIRLVKLIMLVMTLLLIADSISVFFYIGKYIRGDIALIMDIKSYYSNKNILASSVFIRIVFALAMMTFTRDFRQYVGWVAVFLGVLATLFLATRAFFLGLILLSLIYFVHVLMLFFRRKEKRNLWLGLSLMAAVLLSILAFTFVERNYYPGSRGGGLATVSRNIATIANHSFGGRGIPFSDNAIMVGEWPYQAGLSAFLNPAGSASEDWSERSGGGVSRDRRARSIRDQFANISLEETSTARRIDAWRWTFDMVVNNPLLGVGIGNWKIRILEYDNRSNPTFTYLVRAHNDFLEIFAETGIPGGLLYIGIFITLGLNVIKWYRKKGSHQLDILSNALFLAGFGLVCYAIDAFFNFPITRPETLLFWILFISMGIAATAIQKEQADKETVESDAPGKPASLKPDVANKLRLGAWLGIIAIALLLSMAYLLHLKFQSSRLQIYIYYDVRSGNYLHYSYAHFAGQLPSFPNLSEWTEPIASLKARYLINENKNKEAIAVLIDETANPFDSRREYFLALAYNNVGDHEMALFYAERAYNLKPYYLANFFLYVTLLEHHGRFDEIPAHIDHFLKKQNRTAEVWVYAARFYFENGDAIKAWETVLEARRLLRNNRQILEQYEFLEEYRDYLFSSQNLFNKASKHYEANRFDEAIRLLDQHIGFFEHDRNAIKMRAMAHFKNGDCDKSLEDIALFFQHFEKDAMLINIRGICFHKQGRTEEACRDFRQAMQMGNLKGEQNYRLFCSGID